MQTFLTTVMALTVPALLGVAGFLIYAGADLALCFARLTSVGLGYYLLNVCAATLIGVSLIYSFNLGAFLTEVFCRVTSLTAIGLRLRARREAPTALPGLPPGPMGPRAMHLRRIGPGHGLRPDRMI